MGLRTVVFAGAVALLAAGSWWALRPAGPRPLVVPDGETGTLPQGLPAGLEAAGVEASRAAVEVDAEATADPTPAATHRLVGRVVDEARRPVAGARVALAGGGETTSDARGGFELLVTRPDEPPPSPEGLGARDARGRCAYGTVALGVPRGERPERVDAGTLVLGEGFALRVSVVEGGAPAGGSVVHVAVGHSRQDVGQRRTDDSGQLLVEPLPRGPVYLTAMLPGRQGRARAFVPEEGRVVIALEPLGVVDVLVVDARTGAGIAGAALDVREEFPVPLALPGEERGSIGGEHWVSRPGPGDGERTDARGRARVEGLAPGVRYEVGASAAGYLTFPQRPAAGPRLLPGAEPVRIELEPLAVRTVRWPVVAGEVPPPPNGAQIVLRPAPGAYHRGQEPPDLPAGRMEGSLLVADGVAGYAALLARAPDGAMARLWCEEGSDLGGETSFRRPRRVEVRLQDGRGDPVPGAQAIARNQGNNDLCEWAKADAGGLAVLEGLHGELAEIHVRRPDEGGFGENAGTVDLGAGDARLEVILEPLAWLPARLTLMVDGVPRLPARFQVRARAGVRVVDESPQRGELALELRGVRPGERVDVGVAADGFLDATTSVELPDDGSAASARLALERAAVVVAHVTPPEEGAVSILPQRHAPEQGAWSTPPSMRLFNGLHHPNGPAGTYVLQGATPGRWRVLDERSGACSQPAELLAGQGEVELFLDLSAIEWATGLIVVDDPAELDRVRVRVLDPLVEPTATWLPGGEPPEGAWAREGRFRVQVPAEHEVTVVAWHPWLVPDPERGAVRLRGGREGLVLSLVAADELRLPVPGLGPYRRAVRIARHAGEPAGPPLEWHHAPVIDGVARCALPRGTWTLWVDPLEGFAPLVLRDVAVAGPTELPPPELVPGSSVRVRVLVPDGQSPPRIGLFATHLDPPEYQRGMNSDGEAVAVLSGLGPGRFRVRFSTVMGSAPSQEQVVELDGTDDVELELDLR